jgi:hypothetical protein
VNNNRDFLKLQKSHSLAESRSTTSSQGIGYGSGARSHNNTNNNSNAGSPARGAAAGNNMKRCSSFVSGGSGNGSSGGGPPSPGGNGNPFLNSTAMPSLSELGDSAERPPSLRGIASGGGGNSNAGVKSGRADTFNPSVFQNANHVAGVDSDQGLFVDRNKRELQIAEVNLKRCAAFGKIF